MSWSSDRCGGSGFEIDSLNSLAQVVAAANKVAEVLAGDFCLHLELRCLLFLVLQLFDIPLKPNTNIVRRTLECPSNLRADT